MFRFITELVAFAREAVLVSCYERRPVNQMPATRSTPSPKTAVIGDDELSDVSGLGSGSAIAGSVVVVVGFGRMVVVVVAAAVVVVASCVGKLQPIARSASVRS